MPMPNLLFNQNKKNPRPPLNQQRLEKILEEYRDKEDRPGAEKAHLIRLWNEYIYPHRARLLLAIFFALFFQVLPYFYSWYGKFIIDYIVVLGGKIPPAEMYMHYRWCLYSFFIFSASHILTALFMWQNSFQLTFIGQRIVYDMRAALHKKLQTLPLNFFDNIQTGRLLSIVLDDVETLRQTIAGTAVRIISAVMAIIIGLIIMFSQHWVFGVLTIISLPIYVITVLYFRPLLKEANIAARRATSTLYSRMDERVTAVKTVKVFGRERSEVKTFTEAVHNLSRLMLYIIRLSVWQNFLSVIISTLATAVMIFFGIYFLNKGILTAGGVMMLYSNTAAMFAPALTIGDIFMEVQRISVVLRRVFNIMEAEEEPQTKDTKIVEMSHADGSISFDNVTFKYPGDDRETITDLSFNIPAGKQVAIMGPSGSGKSTLLYLLMRFYEPTTGEILLDNHNISDVSLNSLRDRITLVMQEPIIFSSSLADNIRYGNLDASMQEVERAARAADLHEFIVSTKDGYETVVGERGMSLSGGQRQRLALATGLLSRPSVLLLDDTTSALDPATEAKIRKTINRIMKGQTTFIVTHRIMTAMTCDIVVVLEDGKLSQFGAPDDLMKEENGLFKRIYDQQLGE